MQLDRFLRSHDPIRFVVDIMKCSITQVVLQGLRYFSGSDTQKESDLHVSNYVSAFKAFKKSVVKNEHT